MARREQLNDARDARGEETRQRLLAAGLTAFGARGFDGVSTRELAQAAGANQAAIVYHFGGKEQLYVAVAEHVAARGRAALAPLLDRVASEPPLTRATAVTRLSAALHGLVRGLLDLADEGAAAAFVLREQTHPGPGFPQLYDGYIRPLHAHVTRLVAAATGRAPDAAETIIDAHAVVGLALGFAVARATLLRRTGWKAYTPARVEQIAARVAHLACHALAGGDAGDGAPCDAGTRSAMPGPGPTPDDGTRSQSAATAAVPRRGTPRIARRRGR